MHHVVKSNCFFVLFYFTQQCTLFNQNQDHTENISTMYMYTFKHNDMAI